MIVACWSGPRNLSTALMYSFAARGDCAVVDEPFYAAYLAATGLDHPMREAVLAAQPPDPAAVVAGLFAHADEPRVGQKHVYHKHMAHHMLPGFPRDWFSRVRHLFLIRHPARVVASYLARREDPTPDDLGFRQQAALFDEVTAAGLDPVVVDSHDIRRDPAGTLAALCGALGIDWREEMLHWPAGGNPADGVWAAHWYGAVHQSTGFDAAEGPLPVLSGRAADLARQALPIYGRLRRHAIGRSAA